MTLRFFMSYILVNIFRIITNLFETLIPFFSKNIGCSGNTMCKTSRWILAMMLQVMTLSMNIFLTDLEGFVEVTGKNGARCARNGLILGIPKVVTMHWSITKVRDAALLQSTTTR